MARARLWACHKALEIPTASVKDRLPFSDDHDGEDASEEENGEDSYRPAGIAPGAAERTRSRCRVPTPAAAEG
jgi:hypothetical protein